MASDEPPVAPRTPPPLAIGRRGAAALWLVLAFFGAWALAAWFAASGFDAGERRFLGAVALLGSGFAALVSGLLSRTVAVTLGAWLLGTVLGVGVHAGLAGQRAEREAQAQAGEDAAFRRMLAAAAPDAAPAAIADALRDSPVPPSQLVCRMLVEGATDADGMLRLAARVVDTGDRAAPVAQRRRILLMALDALQGGSGLTLDGRLPRWLALWRASEPDARAVSAATDPTEATQDDCGAIGDDTVRRALQEGGLDALHAWREAGLQLSEDQQQALLAPLRTAAEVDAALAPALGLRVDARGDGYLTSARTTALMEHAYGAGLRLGGQPDDPDEAPAIEALLRHGADRRLRDDQGRDACALFEEALRGGAADRAPPAGPQVARVRVLLCDGSGR